ncbi:hypothetical protein [Fusobacterium polymorphum]|uniref:hypothetical protein n=1 Tax=Fusobacterium nucleatum subsp. polymorphum TaxID=76857 RepID=UPI00300A5971
MGLGLPKEYREKVADEEKVENGYNIKFINGEEKFFISKGVIKAIKEYVDENIKDIAEVEAEELTEEEKKESIEIEKVEETTTAVSVLKQEDIEILQKIIAEYKARMNNTNTKTKIDDDFEFDYKNIEIPSEVRKINIDTTLSIRGNKSVYEKIREVAGENGISASLLVNYLFYSFLKTIKKW